MTARRISGSAARIRRRSRLPLGKRRADARDITHADLNADGSIDNFDIDPFVEYLLRGGGP